MLARVNRSYVPAYWDDFFNDSFFNTCSAPAEKSASPSVNVIENDQSFLIEVSVPGVAQKDLNINMENDVLTISTEQKEQEESKNTRYLRREFSLTSFKRNFQLPETIDAEEVSARYEEGILIVELPKKEEVVQKVSRQIEVK